MAQAELAHVHELMEDFDTAMLITQGRGEPAHARPMAIARVEPDCSLWFFTGRDSEKVQDIRDNPQVLMAFQADHRRYLSVRGRAELVTDAAKAAELWKPAFKAWFPQGAEDPDLMLICVRPESAEYWDNQGVKSLRYFFETARAMAQGRRPQVQEGQQHGQVDLGGGRKAA